MFQPNNIAALAAWLTHHVIDLSMWGRDGAKTIENLWQEVQRGDSTLAEDPPLRRVRVAQVWIRKGPLLLVETMQTFANGTTRLVDNPPAEKMQLGESPNQAALRCLHEEMQIPPTQVTVTALPVTCRVEKKPSHSYPGLNASYAIYQIHVTVDNLPDEPFVTTEMSRGTHDPVVTHHWAWRSIATYQSRYAYVT
jgi:hypothetical protein